MQIEHALQEVGVQEQQRGPEASLNPEIEQIVESHSKSVPWDGKLIVRELAPDQKSEKISFHDMPKSLSYENMQITQFGALGQKRSTDDHNNYCGYYAVYNLRCLFLGVDKDIEAHLLNRKEFSELFRRMLNDIKVKRKVPPYDNLDEDEIELLLKNLGISDRQYVPIQLRGLECTFTDLTNVLLQSGIVPASYEVVNEFKTGRTENLNILFNVGLHWVVIKAVREEKGIHFFIVDSLNEVDWLADDMLWTRLLPLHEFLTR